jgi:hypothetical protein
MAPLRYVKVGETILAVTWNAMVKAVQRLRLISGPGVRLTETTQGTVISFDSKNAIFLHPFRCTMTDTEVRIRPGTVNTIRTQIGDKFLDDQEPPALELEDELVLDGDGKGWIALLVTLSKKDWAVEKVEVVQVADLASEDGKSAFVQGTEDPGITGPPPLGGIPGIKDRKVRFPIALIREYEDGSRKIFQTAHFNLQHRVKAVANSDTARHFFYAQ